MLQKILILAAFSLFVGYQAWKKGRIPVLWCLFTFAAGFFKPFYAVFPLILILMLPRLEKGGPLTPAGESGSEEDHADNPSSTPRQAAPAEPPSPPVAFETYPMLGNGTWHLASGGRRSGPYAEDDVIEMLRRGKIRGNTHVWSKGMEDWMPAQDVGNFRAYC
jgi:hypothetical protein